MQELKIDARGLSCPQPVVLTQKALAQGATNLVIVVSSEVSKENVIRFLDRHEMSSSVAVEGDDFVITAAGR